MTRISGEEIGRTAIVGFGAVLCSVFVLFTSSAFVTSDEVSKEGFQDHAPIVIDCNGDFNGWNGVRSGNGSASSPFIISNWRISTDSEDGVRITNTTCHFILEGCSILGVKDHFGIVLRNIDNGTVRNCTISNNSIGVFFQAGYFGGSEDSDLNRIECNIISHNKEGIMFGHIGSDHHERNVIKGNEITENEIGIDMVMCAENTILSNQISDNSKEGIVLSMCMGGGMFNRVYHNNLVGNNGGSDRAQVVQEGGPVNYWNESYPVGGNYWSNFDGSDRRSGPDQDRNDPDGIIDDPFLISSKKLGPHYYENVTDHYPLSDPIEWTSPDTVLPIPPGTEGELALAGGEPMAGVLMASVIVVLIVTIFKMSHKKVRT